MLIAVPVIAILAITSLKWKISTLGLIYYIEKNQYKQPSDEELEECTGFVIENMIKDLTGRSNSH